MGSTPEGKKQSDRSDISLDYCAKGEREVKTHREKLGGSSQAGLEVF